MQDDIRGLFVLDPPRGGLARLRHSLRDAGPAQRWLPWMPWATAAGLLLAIVLSVHRGGVAFTARIIEDVQVQEQGRWIALQPRQGDLQVYLARPIPGEPGQSPP